MKPHLGILRCDLDAAGFERAQNRKRRLSLDRHPIDSKLAQGIEAALGAASVDEKRADHVAATRIADQINEAIHLALGCGHDILVKTENQAFQNGIQRRIPAQIFRAQTGLTRQNIENRGVAEINPRLIDGKAGLVPPYLRLA